MSEREHEGADAPEQGDGKLVGQPHGDASDGPVAEAEAIAADMSTEDAPMGELGRPFNWRAPFFIGLAATVGVAVTVGAIGLLILAAHVILLIGLSLFLAIGMEPAASWLVRHRTPRWLAVVIVILVILGALGGFLAAAIPATVTQVEHLTSNLPQLVKQLEDNSTSVGRLVTKFNLEQRAKDLLSGTDSIVSVSGVLSIGAAIFSAFSNTLIVLVLTIFFLANMPQLRTFLYRFVPNSRRPRAILIGDDILHKVGVYVLGNLLISVIAGVLTYIWLLVFGVPYALLLAILVALLDLVPVVGSTLAGVIVAAVALTVSLPVCLLTIGFFLLYRLLEDYLLVPRIIGKAVHVPALVTVVAVIVGGALLGIIGALVAIPAAAALLLIFREVTFPRMDQV